MLNSWSQLSWAGLDRVFSCFRHRLLQNPPRHRSHIALGWSNGSLLLFTTADYSRDSWNNCSVWWTNKTIPHLTSILHKWADDSGFNCSTQGPSPHASSSEHHTDKQGTELLPPADRDSLAFLLPAHCMAFGQFTSPHLHSSSPWMDKHVWLTALLRSQHPW